MRVTVIFASSFSQFAASQGSSKRSSGAHLAKMLFGPGIARWVHRHSWRECGCGELGKPIRYIVRCPQPFELQMRCSWCQDQSTAPSGGWGGEGNRPTCLLAPAAPVVDRRCRPLAWPGRWLFYFKTLTTIPPFLIWRRPRRLVSNEMNCLASWLTPLI